MTTRLYSSERIEQIGKNNLGKGCFVAVFLYYPARLIR